MPEHRVKIRGIYATALTAILKEKGFVIVDPTPVMASRLGLSYQAGPEEASIRDRHDRQGIVVTGLREAVEATLRAILEAVPFALLVPIKDNIHGALALALAPLQAHYLVEFPLPAKEVLDTIRGRYVPTVPGHHYFKIIDAASVDRYEQAMKPGQEEPIRRALLDELVAPFYRRGAEVKVWHVKAGGEGFQFRALVRSFQPGERLVLERRFRGGGFYDGLGLSKEEGDVGLVEMWEGRWFIRRVYLRRNGTLIGEVYNVNTPPELYPGWVRYLDLEVDVVCLPKGEVEIQDEQVLWRKVEKGLLPRALAEKAMACAQELFMSLRDLA